MSKSRSGKQSHLQYNREYNRVNRVKCAVSRQQFVQRNAPVLLAWLDTIRNASPCQCGESDIACLDFDHRDPSTKKGSPCVMARHAQARATIQAELDKCDVVCSNCHRKKHFHVSYNYIKRNAKTKYIYELKSRSACACGESHVSCLDFHHVRGEKVSSVSRMALSPQYSLDDVIVECEKCDIICANCHRKHHRSQRSMYPPHHV